MKKQEVIAQLCELASMVGNDVFNSQLPHDCFCDPLPDPYYQFDSQVMEFISNAVKSAIAEFKSGMKKS